MTVEPSVTADIRRLGEYLPGPRAEIERVGRQLFEAGGYPPPPGLGGGRARIGEALVHAGVITRDQLLSALHAQRVDRLRNCPLFARLSDAELRAIAQFATEATAPSGREFITQDAPGRCLYVIAAGRVFVYRKGDDGEEIPLGAAWPGETIGEMGYFSPDGMRSACARAVEDVQLLEIAYDDLPRCMEVAPNLATGFLNLVTRRLHETNLRYQTSAHRRRSAERSLRQIGTYLDLSADLALGLGIEELIDRVVRTASKVMEADRASLFLVDPVTGELWSKVAEGTEGVREIRVPPGTGIAGWVAQHGRFLNVPDAYEDERFNRDNDLKTGYRTRTILCGPVRNLQGMVVGVIQVINKRHGTFDENDEALFRAFAHQAAIAVENFSLYRRLASSNQKMAIMLDVATSLSQTLDLPALIRKIVAKIGEILNCERSSFFVYDRQVNELWSMEAAGSGLTEIRFPATAGLAGHTARTGEVLNVRDAYSDERFNPEFDRKTGFLTRNVLCVPVFDREGRVAGVTQAINKRGASSFEAEDVELLRAISAQIATALENAQLYARTVDLKNYMESVQQSISNCIFTLDNDWRVITANQATLAMFDRPADQFVGRDARETLGERNGTLVAMMERVYAEHRKAEDDDIEIHPGPNKTCTVNATVLPLTDHEGRERGQVVVIEDITQERRVKNTLTRYMAKDIVERLLSDPAGHKLGGVRSKATVLFSDIREFTTISEQMSAPQTLDFLNEYFTLMVEEVFKHRGTFDKFIGDAMMAVFGVPYAQPDDAVRAVRTALAMSEVLAGFNARRKAAGLPPVLMGVGINTDEIVSGNMGHLRQMNYTVIGDGVNTASRLEGLNKYYGTQILISDRTRQELDNQFTVRAVDRVLAKGKNRPVFIYEVLGPAGREPTEGQRMFDAGYAAYQDRRFAEALDLFKQGAERGDGPSAVFAGRCEQFLLAPPPADWDGVWRAVDK